MIDLEKETIYLYRLKLHEDIRHFWRNGVNILVLEVKADALKDGEI